MVLDQRILRVPDGVLISQVQSLRGELEGARLEEAPLFVRVARIYVVGSI